MPSRDANEQRAGLTALSAALRDEHQTFAARYDAVRDYLDGLAKPVGALGGLEDWAARLAALRRSAAPRAAPRAACLLFAADHGVAKDARDGGRSCSAYPPAVTRKVVEGLDRGVAGAAVLAACHGVALRVVDVGVAEGADDDGAARAWSGDVVRAAGDKVRGGTRNFCQGCAMTPEEVERCVQSGRDETAKFVEETGGDIVLFGEVGIGNTTTSSALIAALTDVDVKLLCGTGAATTRDGVDDEALAKKIAIVEDAMQRHDRAALRGRPLRALAAVGGAEIAALVGGLLEASDRDRPVLVDGFIATTAAMLACQLDPRVARVLLFATRSTERGQAVAVDAIRAAARAAGLPAPAPPALDLALRLGEGTGALLAVPLARSACAVLAGMATLDEVLAADG